VKTVLILLISALSLNAVAKPKYGPEATPLSKSHEYLREKQAPDYWALSPYYAQQMNRKACSLASIAMLLNAARTSRPLTADDELITQDKLLEKVNDKNWNEDISLKSLKVTNLNEMKTIIEESLKAYGFESFTVEAVHMDDTPSSRAKLHKDLVENEKSSKDFIVLNFLQSVYTGDADVGHVSPLGAYDKKRKRALVMDVDREWYEPYWVSEETLAKGMATKDKTSGLNRGYLYIKLSD
jgi:hypothetical protein